MCVFSCHSFWTSSSLDVPAGVTQEEGHTGFLIHLLSVVRALVSLARRIQPFLPSSTVKSNFVYYNDSIFLKKLCTLTNQNTISGELCICTACAIWYTRAQIDAPARLEAHYALNNYFWWHLLLMIGVTFVLFCFVFSSLCFRWSRGPSFNRPSIWRGRRGQTSPGEERGNETGKVAIAHGSVEFCEATPIGLADES